MLSLLLIGSGSVLLADGGLAEERRHAEPKAAVIAAAKPAAAPARKPASPASNTPRQPYEGVWASDKAGCRDEDGANRLSIEGNRFFWYETRCRAHDIKAGNGHSWAMRMSCEGEGAKYRAQPRLSLAPPNRLILDGSPVGQTKRDVYVRCEGRPPR
jgi:hypothetical protein